MDVEQSFCSPLELWQLQQSFVQFVRTNGSFYLPGQLQERALEPILVPSFPLPQRYAGRGYDLVLNS
jgi:hypothetical protein